jgi:hypothetical protein
MWEEGKWEEDICQEGMCEGIWRRKAVRSSRK